MIKVLVVDHAAGSRRGIRTVLQADRVPGFQIKFVSCYRDIIEAFRANAHDVCLIDSASGNGLRLFIQGRSLGYAAPVILVTSNDAREAINAIGSGASDCLIRDELSAAGIERMICSVVELDRELNQRDERARRYLALMDNADEIIFTHDLEGNCTSMNPAGEQLIGCSQQQWMSQNVSEFISPDHRDVAQKIVKRTLDSRNQTRCQIEVVSRQGQCVLVEARLHLVYLHGKAVEVQWAARLLSSRQSNSIFRSTHFHDARQSVGPRVSA
ncbi:MAG TPA: PAS domain S-box protein [Pyrinomonadaceae bacterium]|nr:PAS domain S-box protein [Pyrinomonadaceae bacterium]